MRTLEPVIVEAAALRACCRVIGGRLDRLTVATGAGRRWLGRLAGSLLAYVLVLARITLVAVALLPKFTIPFGGCCWRRRWCWRWRGRPAAAAARAEALRLD